MWTSKVAGRLILAGTLLLPMACGGQAPKTTTAAKPAPRPAMGSTASARPTQAPKGNQLGARDRASLAARADCAEISMALAFGDRVSEADKAKCSNVKFTKETTKTVAAPPPPAVKPPPPVRTAPHTSRPEWVDRLPSSEGDILYGTGVGLSLIHI